MSPDKTLAVWRLALSSLHRNIPVMLLYVLESKGSSPGRHGFLMTVNALGEREGSIGGGIMEHKFLELARERLLQNETSILVRKQVHDKTATRDQSGMICSGEQTNLLYTLQTADIPALEEIVASLEQRRNGCLTLSPHGVSFHPNAPDQDYSFQRSTETSWIYREKTGFKNRLFLIGGGHVALAFSRIIRTLDFHITLFDHRQDLDSLKRNDFVHERVLLEEYRELSGLVRGGETHYVVVMTQGYRTDDLAVRALLPLDFRYFGLLGSKAKIKKMLADYRAEGIPEDRLNRLSAPAGLAIQSQTPEEIAISIAAEIIQRIPR